MQTTPPAHVASCARRASFLLGAVIVSSLLAASGCRPSTESGDELATGGAESPLDSVSLVANPSLEVVNAAKPSEPSSWRPASWGGNKATFKYDATDANTGTRSVRIDMATWSSGDAKWVFDSVPVPSGGGLIYRDYYKSTVTTKLVAEYTMAGGTSAFATLATSPARATWSPAAAELTAPAGATRVTVYRLIATPGTVQIDDVSLSVPRPADLSSGVPNGSLEQASEVDSNQPLAWRSGGWGTNKATFKYDAADANTGTRSVRVDMTAWSSGDAKWIFDSIAISPGVSLAYRDYYKSTVTTKVVAEFTMAGGTSAFVTLATDPARATWSPAAAALTAPAGATRVTVYRLISSPGTVQIDDASLAVLPPTTIVNGIPNGDLEQVAIPGAVGPNLPAAWHPNLWGTSTTSFSYLVDALSGNHTIRTDMAAYTSGAASWYFDPIPVVAGQPYRATVRYRSSADVSIQALVTRADGTSVYVELPSASTAPDWTSYSAKTYLPLNAASVTLYFKLSRVGYVELDDAGFLPTTTLPFQRGLVSLTFDDGWVTDYTAALPILTQYAVPATHYVITEMLGSPDRLTVRMMSALQGRGDEIASHTVTHPDLTTISPADLSTELVSSRLVLEANGFGPVLDFASPYGSYDSTVVAALKQTYQSHRTVDTGFNSLDDFDAYRLKVQNALSTTTASDVDGWVARAAADRTWLIMVYHDVKDGPQATIYSTSPANLAAQLAVIRARGLPVVTVRQALNELLPQLTTP